MADRDAFETRFHVAVHRYVEHVSSTLDPYRLVGQIAAEEPRGRRFGGVVRWRGVAVPQLAWVLLLLAALLATTLGGLLVAGSKPAWTIPAVVPPLAPIAWPAWAPASSADTALVDRMNEIMSDRDVAALGEIFAEDLVFTVEGEVYGGLEGMRENMAGGVFVTRIGDVAVTTDPVPGLWSLPAGSRFLAFVDSTAGERRDFVLEVNDEDRVAVVYNDAHKPPDERARDGYTNVDFAIVVDTAVSSVGMAVLSEAKLTLVETDRVEPSEVAGCQGAPDGSGFVFLHLRLEDYQLSYRNGASDTVEVQGPAGERLEPVSCQHEPIFQPATDTRDGWIAVAAPTDAAGRLSLVYRHVNEAAGDQGPEVFEALIPFELPPG